MEFELTVKNDCTTIVDAGMEVTPFRCPSDPPEVRQYGMCWDIEHLTGNWSLDRLQITGKDVMIAAQNSNINLDVADWYKPMTQTLLQYLRAEMEDVLGPYPTTRIVFILQAGGDVIAKSISLMDEE